MSRAEQAERITAWMWRTSGLKETEWFWTHRGQWPRDDFKAKMLELMKGPDNEQSLGEGLMRGLGESAEDIASGKPLSSSQNDAS